MAPAVSCVPAEVATWNLAVGERLDLGDFLAEMERGMERFHLLQQPVDQFLRAANRQRGDVVDRLVGIELGALAADLRRANR